MTNCSAIFLSHLGSEIVDNHPRNRNNIEGGVIKKKYVSRIEVDDTQLVNNYEKYYSTTIQFIYGMKVRKRCALTNVQACVKIIKFFLNTLIQLYGITYTNIMRYLCL